jgi:FkbM family methyltransferase
MTMMKRANAKVFKCYAQHSLARLGLYERAKASWIYDVYWTIADKKIIDDRRKESEFYCDLLEGFKPGDLIFDIGANQGYKTQMFLKMGARVIAVDPDGTNQEILREKFLKNRLKKMPVVIVGKAVSEENSMITMWINSPGSALNTLSRKWAETLKNDDQRFGHSVGFESTREVETVSLEYLIGAHGLPYFVKIDVEGHELSVLKGLRQPVPYISFEVNLPEFLLEGMECIRVLAELEGHGEFNYSSDCKRGLALNQWICHKDFVTVVDSCVARSIEVFWRSPRRRTR